ncbi:MAG: hydrogenase iron-sulfur subunit, partial [Chloroflexi bacterium]|nr:hydrogenase iron-sulfur subunit [Chloroflexota bacterium]
GGADGVMISGCHPGDCHYIDQNYKALRRVLLLRRTLKGMGVEPERIKLVWASAAEGMQLAHEIDSFIEEVRKLGPLGWPKWNETDHGSQTIDDEQAPVAHGQEAEVTA